MSRVEVAVIGAGPYGLSVAAHLAHRDIEHRIFGRPMQFWSKVAAAGTGRFLKSFCFGTNISSPNSGFSFNDYSQPRGLETFEPCSIGDFSNYGRWFQELNVPWLEPFNVTNVARDGDGFLLTLDTGERCWAAHVIVATGLAYCAHTPPALASLPSLVSHTSDIQSFAAFKGRSVAVIGAGQSALEAAALLHEADARPHLLVRGNSLSWHRRASQQPTLWQRVRSPITGLGTGPKAWALTRYPGGVHRMPTAWRTRFVKRHLPAEGAWWLRPRVEGIVPLDTSATVTAARAESDGVTLSVRGATGQDRSVHFDHVVAGSGYVIDVDRLDFLDPTLRNSIERLGRSPKLNARFEASVPGLRFVGPISSMSFGPLYRFVVGADYTARVVTASLAARKKLPA